MKLDKLFSLIENSKAEDWTRVDAPVFVQDVRQGSHSGDVPSVSVEEHDVLISFKPDLRISIAVGFPNPSEVFEKWAHSFPGKVFSDFIDFRFNGVAVTRGVRVLVDGAATGLPVPEGKDMVIPKRQYRIWRLLNEFSGGGDFDDYFKRAGMTIGTAAWPT